MRIPLTIPSQERETETVLEALSLGRVFDIEKAPGGGFVIREECDGFFTATLTREQLLQLAEEIITLAKSEAHT